ncbi:MAG: hypothetical protein KDA25_08645, partial [Phycisphaerales bacterium]|nr:hypothetical protein [Phycisphaerales bacterium]
MNKLFAISIGLVLLVLLLLFSTTYTVAYHEVAIKTTFGQTGEGDASVIRDPGLKFKLPFFADRVKHLDTRVQLTESPLKTMPTADRQQVEIKAFLLWRVDVADTGPIEFMRSFATQADAEDKIKGQLEAALGAVSRFRFDDILGRESKMAAIEAAVLDELRRNLSPGVNAEMIGFSQVALASKTTTGVLGRMKADLEA